MNLSIIEFRALLAQVRAGDSRAADELFQQFSPLILRVVRRRLSAALRVKFDSTDFVQAVWAAFFEVLERRDFADPDELAKFLLAVARNKLCDEIRRRVRNERRTLANDAPLAAPPFPTETDWDRVDLRQPRPSQVAVLRERWRLLVASQPPLHRQIFEMRFQGSTFAEIATELNVHERTARRVFERLARDF